jgi:peptidoglycan/LPS O-acetylase OafA/YrhL
VTLAGLVLLFLVLGTSSRKGLVNGSTLQFFGYISYGLYLFHPMIFRIYDKVTRIFWPWLQPSVGHFGLIVLRFAVVSAAAIGLSFISRKYYEEGRCDCTPGSRDRKRSFRVVLKMNTKLAEALRKR